MIKNIFLLTLVLVLALACHTFNYRNLKPLESKKTSNTDLPSLFKNSVPAPLYKTNVNLYGKKFGGLLLLKYMPDSSYRVVFTTETGMKLFDFSLTPDTFKVEYCIDKFKRDAVLNTIANDIQLLLLEYRTNQNAQLLSDASKNYRIFKFTKQEVAAYYFFTNKDSKLEKVEQSVGKKQKVVISLQEYKATVPSSIKIVHHNIRLKIDLTLIER